MMAKQIGVLPLQGTLGNVTFYKTADGYIAKEKSAISAQRLKTDPAFQRTRENWAEFGKAGIACKMLRSAFSQLVQNSTDRRMVNRLTKDMMVVIKADQTNERGLRNVLDGETELLTGFEFNDKAKLNATLIAPFTANINRVAGELILDIPAFVPATMVKAPSGATHFKLISGGAGIDFEKSSYQSQELQTAPIPWDHTPTTPYNIVHTIQANNPHPMFLLLGVEFLQEVSGKFYPLKNGGFNSLCIVKVSGV